MRYLVRILVTTIVLLYCSAEVAAQFSISAEIRPRLELRNGFRTPRLENSEAAFFISQRTRLNIGFQNDKIKLFMSPQDIRTWGSEKQVGRDPSFGLHEGWVELLLTEKVSLKAGRQEMIYDGHRLLGSLNWVQQARSHDAMLFKYANEKFKTDFAAAFNQSSETLFNTNYRTDNYKVLVMAHMQNQYESIKWNAMFITDAFQKVDTIQDLFWRYTIGGGLGWFNSNFNVDGSIYYQGGKTRTDVDIAAFMFNLKAQYKFEKLTLAGGLDFISGDDSEDSENYGAFNTLYATNHKFYGFMDYYLNIPNDTKHGGLQDYFLSLNYKTGSKTSILFAYHQFLLANDVFDGTTAVESNLGGEIDLAFAYKFAPYATLNGGISTYFANETTVFIKGTGDHDAGNYWGWLMLTIKPELFNSKSLKK